MSSKHPEKSSLYTPSSIRLTLEQGVHADSFMEPQRDKSLRSCWWIICMGLYMCDPLTLDFADSHTSTQPMSNLEYFGVDQMRYRTREFVPQYYVRKGWPKKRHRRWERDGAKACMLRLYVKCFLSNSCRLKRLAIKKGERRCTEHWGAVSNVSPVTIGVRIDRGTRETIYSSRFQGQMFSQFQLKID